MKTNPSPAERRHAAQTALQALSTQRDEHLLCSVRCTRSHHVAAVYDTAAGPVCCPGPNCRTRWLGINANCSSPDPLNCYPQQDGCARQS